MQTFHELRLSVTAELDGKDERIRKRRAKIFRLSKKLGKWREARSKDKRFRIRARGASLTINESTLLEGGETSLHLNVEVLGARVGMIEFSVGKAPAFSPAAAYRTPVVDPKNQRLAERLTLCLADRSWKAKWTKDREDGELLNYFLELAGRRANTKKRQDERIIQALLNSALAANKTSGRNAYSIFKGFQPVVPGAAMEIGTVLSTDPEGKTGQADILVRHRAGIDTQFLVFELKTPDGDEPAAALTQAIRYALSLQAEANHDAKTIAAYRHMFGSRSAAPLRLGAVAVVAEEHKAEAEAALCSLGATGEMPVGVLLYSRIENWAEAERFPIDGLKFLGDRFTAE